MAKRYVYKTKKDQDGDILALCNDTATWSPRQKAGAIQDIELGTHSYYVRGETKIEVVNGPNGKYLRTQRDGSSSNNLDELPDC